MKKILIIAAIVTLTGCSLLPRSHDPVMFERLVVLNIDIGGIDCNDPQWTPVARSAEILARSAEWRNDPQATNLDGLHNHVVRLAQGGSVTFCELGKRTAAQRINAVKTAWGGRR